MDSTFEKKNYARVEEQDLLKTFQMVNAYVPLSTRGQTAGSLFDSCYEKGKFQVDKILSCKKQNI
ncbi:hypothetical protein PsorP6_007508 [Peronosclerospora sorghi]|uniref:Uncharacterized protein n=1 Tax=Peronosclerospora sorghi TaxID=230839 RepID=A0ACC0WBF4_9STRA|nr:hypothetical protein PsorP6_007508 [Peronosclerospora sorghi]